MADDRTTASPTRDERFHDEYELGHWQTTPRRHRETFSVRDPAPQREDYDLDMALDE